MSVRAVPLLILLASVTLAGCFGGDEPRAADTPQDPIVNHNTTDSPAPTGPVVPPCALVAQDLEMPSGDGAPAPSGPVTATIKRDAYGVPHIYADDPYSLFYANGYVQAQDRLFQLDALRLVGYGRSAQYLGAGQLASDMQVARDLYTEAEIQAQVDTLPAELHEVLQAYTDGVNRVMAERIATGTLPGEFPAVGRVPVPWSVADSVAVIDYLIGYFGVAGGGEVGNAQVLDALDASLGDPDKAWTAFGDLDWLSATHTYTTIPVEDKAVNGCESVPARTEVPAEQLAMAQAAADAVPFGIPSGPDGGLPVPDATGDLQAAMRDVFEGQRIGHGMLEGFHWGSNALLVNGSRTATGQPIMFGAPQMGYYKPPVPYQIGLHGAGFDATGIGVAGAPGIVIGQNHALAWSVTSGIDDQVDTYAVRLGDEPRSYVWDGETRSMDCWNVTHTVGATPAEAAAGNTDPPTTYTQEVCRVEGMPVVAWNEDAGIAYAQRTTTRGEELLGAWMWLNVAKQDTPEAVRTLLGSFPFTFNFHVASKDGIMYLHTGDVPLRADGYDPRLPMPGGSATAWKGEVYTRGMDTWGTDPSSGFYANWNNAPVYGWRTGDTMMNWGSAHRVQVLDRYARAVVDRGNVTWDDVAAINRAAATHDSLGMHIAVPLRDAARASGDEALAPMADALDAWIADGLPWRDADKDGLYDDPGHAIYDAALLQLVERVYGDEMGDRTPVVHLDPQESGDPHAGDHGRHDNDFVTLADALRGDTGHAWCDDVTTMKKETCQEILVAVLRTVQADLSQEYGGDVSGWLQPEHLSRFTAIGAGNADTIPMVNRGSWVQVVSLAEPEKSGSSLPPSNSGHMTGPELVWTVGGVGAEPDRLTSELQLYVDFGYKPFPLDSDAVDAVAESEETLVIIPPPDLPL